MECVPRHADSAHTTNDSGLMGIINFISDTDRTGLHRVIKCENIDPGQFAIKEEPQESFGFISEIKTENNEELQNSLRN